MRSIDPARLALGVDFGKVPTVPPGGMDREIHPKRTV